MFVKSGFRNEAVRADITGAEVLLMLTLHVFLVLRDRTELGPADGAGQTTTRSLTRHSRQLSLVLRGRRMGLSTIFVVQIDTKPMPGRY